MGNSFNTTPAAPPPSTPAVGYWSSQVRMERRLGQFAADVLSNLNPEPGAGDVATPDPGGFQEALDETDRLWNYTLSVKFYPIPFPTSSIVFGVLADRATDYACSVLYFARGVRDAKGNIEGVFNDLRAQAIAQLRRIVRNGINDVPRPGLSRAPAVILSPAITPYGSSSTVTLPASQIPQLP